MYRRPVDLITTIHIYNDDLGVPGAYDKSLPCRGEVCGYILPEHSDDSSLFLLYIMTGKHIKANQTIALISRYFDLMSK